MVVDAALPIVDSHTHVRAGAGRRLPFITDEDSEATAWFVRHGVTADQLLDRMSASGVAGGVLVQALGSHGYDNRLVMADAEASGGRLVCVAAVDTADPDLRSTLRSLGERHVAGVRLFDSPATSVDGLAAQRVAEWAAEEGVTLVVFLGPGRVDALRRLVEWHPGTRIVADHMAQPDLTAGPPWRDLDPILELTEVGAVTLKLTSMNLQAAPDGAARDLVGHLVDRVGSGRLVWGSDFSHTYQPGYEALVELARWATAELTPADRRSVLAGTAVDLWPRLAAWAAASA